jgi:recombination protein RecT
MTQVTTTQNKPATIKSFFDNPQVAKRFEDIIGDKTRSIQFVSSVLQIANGNNYLKNADPLTIYNAALMAATLNLPINQNLGFAYIVPYNNKKENRQEAQFQIGYKGVIQLAQRSGQYKSINVTEIYENQFKSFNYLTEELDADFSIVGQGKVVGFAAYFKLLNGFEKTSYWSIEKVEAHAKKYSKSYSFGPWKTDFNSMAKKTVLKLMLSTYGPLSVEVQKAIEVDQAVIKNEDGTELEYVDHEEIKVNPESERLIALIEGATSLKELEGYQEAINTLEDEEVRAVYQDKYMELSPVE